MSQLQIRNTLLTQVVATLTPLVGDNIAFENKDFDTTGVDTWCSTHFNPVTSDSLGKGVLSCDDERGFMQVSVFVKLNSDDYDNQQLTIMDELKKSFYNGAIMDSIVILEVTINNGFIVDSYYKRDLTINYTSYQQRG
tara:strand:+ start:16 stop:429 length:414 start_codon:yes stop_codon:yes gene_type:complete